MGRKHLWLGPSVNIESPFTRSNYLNIKRELERLEGPKAANYRGLKHASRSREESRARNRRYEGHRPNHRPALPPGRRNRALLLENPRRSRRSQQSRVGALYGPA